MIKKFKTTKLLSIAAIAGIITLTVHETAYAAQCAGVETAVLSCSGGADALPDLVRQIALILTGMVGVAAVGAVVAGAIFYGMAGGKPENIQKAKTIWINTVIGLVVYAFFVAITNFLIPGGVF